MAVALGLDFSTRSFLCAGALGDSAAHPGVIPKSTLDVFVLFVSLVATGLVAACSSVGSIKSSSSSQMAGAGAALAGAGAAGVGAAGTGAAGAGQPTGGNVLDGGAAADVDARGPGGDMLDASSTSDSDASALANTVAPPIRGSALLQSSQAFILPPAPFAVIHGEGASGHVELMHSFASSIGSDRTEDCNHCHVDWENESIRVNGTTWIARHMWDDILGKLELIDGQPLYCDSCHQGKAKFLDRSNIDAVEAWMQVNMVDKLRRRDGLPHDCESCHAAAPRNDDLLTAWSKP